ncbi:MAG: serine hydrolase [Clostridia bacterium]|nr:serine hydrolase [Clostridia bacterium]
MKKLNVEKLNALVDARVQADIDSGKVGGAALCVVQDGKVLLRKLYGYKNVDTKEPLQFDTMYRLASMTKPITAVAALIAREQGLLTIDDPLYKYIPAYEHMKIGHMEDGKPVTTRTPLPPLLSSTCFLIPAALARWRWVIMPGPLCPRRMQRPPRA